MTQSFKQHLKYLMLGAFLLLQTASVSTVQAYGWSWDIKEFNTTVQINKDSTITVTEHIQADFTKEEHHGIFRLIPVKYVDTKGQNSSIPLTVLSVTDDAGKAWQYDVIDEGDYINVKIGDPDVLLNDLENYNITYKAERALGNYDNYDEIYWNATGDKWEVPIEKASVTVKMPVSVDPKQLKATCYTGGYGSKEQNCTNEIVDGTTIKYTAVPAAGAGEPALQSLEGLTIVGGFPKGLVAPTPPSPEEIYAKAPWYQKLFLFFFFNWGFLIPLLVAILMTYIWYTKGRDPETTHTAIMPLYTAPDDLKPTEIGTIIDESVDIRDITSAIVDLAIKGYLKIVETKDKALFFNITNYSFTLLKPDFKADAKLDDYEKKILEAVFGNVTERTLNDLNNEFYKSIPDIKKKVYAGLVTKGYFPTDPEKIRGIYLGIGIALVFGCLVLMGALIAILPWSVPIGVLLSGIIILGFANYMPAKTAKGVDTRYKILGLQEFIQTAEADRLKFQEKENIFEKLLPYAMTLGIAAKWTKAFEGIYKTPPSWYSSNDPYFMTNFSTVHFLNSMNALTGSMNTTLQSQPRSSGSGFGGGGFSGGGGGGGGGGAW